MDRINWPAAIFLAVTPLAALIWAGLHIYTSGIWATELIACFAYLAVVAMSITGGYHRLFAHRAYKCSRIVQIGYLLFGAGAFQHSVLSWASDHRRHHKYLDHDGDPYNIRRGFVWAHIGWMLVNDHKGARFSNVPDLSADPLIRLQHRFYIPLAIAMGFGVPWTIGYAVGDPWGFLLWAGLVRIVVGHHTTFLVNSLAHTLGTRPYTRAVSARDSVVTALLTFGEGYHNFHHRFAADYRNGVRGHQWDPTKWLIRTLAAVGCAWDLRQAPRERIVAAQLDCDAQRLLERWKLHSDEAVARIRDAVADIRTAVEHAAQRVGALEREWAQVRRVARQERQRQLVRLRAELRQARREFRVARQRWRQALRDVQAGGQIQVASW
jgi:stearoyl-CoA desaturase (Delta-9 desaturase)